MDPQSIVLIVGVAILIMERMFACMNRIKISKCCGGELQLTTSSPKKKNLNESETGPTEQEIDERMNKVINSLERIKRTSEKVEDVNVFIAPK